MQLKVLCYATLIWLPSSPTLLKRDMKDFVPLIICQIHCTIITSLGGDALHSRLLDGLSRRRIFVQYLSPNGQILLNFTQNVVEIYVWMHKYFPPHIRRCRNDVGLTVPYRPCSVALNEAPHVISLRPFCIHVSSPTKFKWLPDYPTKSNSS